MIGILIKYKEKVLFTSLPKEKGRLEDKLSGIGLNVPLKSIALTNHNESGYLIEVFSQNKLDSEIVSRIVRHDDLEKLNDIMTYISAADDDAMYNRIHESDATSITELYRAVTAPSELETTDKLVVKTTLNYKTSYYEPVNCIVEKAIALPHESFGALINITANSYDFIEENQEYMFYDKEHNCHCILVYDEESGDGMLINAEGYDYARYSAYVPHAKELLKQHEITINGSAAENASVTESEKRLLNVISDIADRIAASAHSGHNDFNIEDVMNELDCDLAEIKGMIRASAAELLREKPGIVSVEVSDLDIPMQPEITVTTDTADNEEISGFLYK